MLFVCLIALVCSSAVADDDNVKWNHQKVARFTRSLVLPVPVLVADNGYTVETHSVTTIDGYILEMHRIPATPRSPAANNKPVVFIMHGLLCSSADWVIMGPERGLAYILADAGYDVWMGNARGNTYSRNHKTITNLDGTDFWNFSWHEIGIYDLPAMIDYALATTGQKQVIYIGHSQGTTSFYVMASMRPRYNDKIKAMFSLAPVAYMGHAHSPLLRFSSIVAYSLAAFTKLTSLNEFLPTSQLLRSAGSNLCRDNLFTQKLCSNILFVLCGFDSAQLNNTALPTILAYTPAGSSTRQLLHYVQEARSLQFAQYDYTLIGNKYKYGSWTPPKYDLSKISAPVHLIYSDNDWLSAVKDVTQLYNELGNPIEMVRVGDRQWNHLDYLWGIDVKKRVYDHILTTLDEYDNY